MVDVMVVMVCCSQLCDGRTVDVMVVMVSAVNCVRAEWWL